MNKKNINKKELEFLIDNEWENAGIEAEEYPEINSNKMKSTIKLKIAEKQAKNAMLKKALSIAAGIVLVVVSSVILHSKVNQNNKPKKLATLNWIEKSTQPANNSKITLPDGSIVRLNNATTIRFPEKFEKYKRIVELDGEAFFEVKHDETRPFIVKSNGIKTKVLGTTFNVCSYSGENTEVTVATGKVRVSSSSLSSQSNLILLPDDQAVFSLKRNKLIKRQVNSLDYIAWKDGILQLNNITLGQAAKKLERWYDVKITFQNLNITDNVIHASYKNERLDNILKSFKIIEDIDYEMTRNNEIIIY